MTPAASPAAEDYVAFFDVETQDRIAQMPGRSHDEKVPHLQISVACVLTAPSHLCMRPEDAPEALQQATTHSFWREKDGDMRAMIELLLNARAVVGFNVFGFDYKVLKKHARGGEMMAISIKTLDVFSRVRETTGTWYKLDLLLTLNGLAAKTGDGLEAITMYENGEYERLQSYCASDVRLTAQLALLQRMKVASNVYLPAHVFGIAPFLHSMQAH